MHKKKAFSESVTLHRHHLTSTDNHMHNTYIDHHLQSTHTLVGTDTKEYDLDVDGVLWTAEFCVDASTKHTMAGSSTLQLLQC